MKAHSPTLSQISFKSAQWLIKSWNSSYGSDQTLVHNALALAGLCSLLDPSSSSEMEDFIRQLDKEANGFNFACNELVPSLVGASIALKFNALPVYEAAVDYFDVLGEIAPALSSGSNAILIRLALDGCSDSDTEEAPSSMDINLSLFSSNKIEHIKQVLEKVEIATQFGTKSCKVSSPSMQLLEGAAIHALQRYDLPLAMRCLRARGYMNKQASLGLRSGKSFIQLIQCSDGSFGDFESAIEKMKLEPERSNSAELHIKLPITFQALWTLAELESTDFRLFQEAFGQIGCSSLIQNSGK